LLNLQHKAALPGIDSAPVLPTDIMNQKVKKIISYGIVFLIFFFLARGLLADWQNMERIEYSFRWRYLLISTVLFFVSISSFGLVWRAIYSILDKSRRISIFNALKIYLYSQFGRYLPGKAWAYVGMIYLGEREGLPRNILAASVVYQIVLSVAASFIFPLVILSFAPGLLPAGLNYFPLLLIAAGLGCLHPAIFNPMLGVALRILKIGELSKGVFLNFADLVKIILLYFLAFVVNGIAFFFFTNAFFAAAWHDILNFAAFFILASALGAAAVFAPSGLGVREGFLTLFMKRYFTVSGAVFISLAVRIWATIIEVIIFLAVYLIARRKLIKNVSRRSYSK
jgi:uncharacterized membrane protein YbhN (UPF0104 family)